MKVKDVIRMLSEYPEDAEINAYDSAIRNKIKARIEELGNCEWCKDGKGKCPAYRGEEATLLNCGDVNCSKASVIMELNALLSGTCAD